MTITYPKHRTVRNILFTRWTLLSTAALVCACSAGANAGSAGAKGTTAASQPPPTLEPSMTQDLLRVRAAENIWAASLQSGDARLLSTIIDPSFTFIGPDGQVEDRKAYLAGYEQLPKLGIRVQSIAIDEVDVRIFGDVAIVTGHVIAKLTMQQAPITENVRFTRVYHRKADGWLMISGQGTRLAGV